MTQADPQTHLARLQRWSLLAGVVGIAVCAGGFTLDREQFFRSYLLGYAFWASISVGCLAQAMLHHLVQGEWGALTLRLLEGGTRTLLLMGVLFVPLLFGLPDAYPWAQSGFASGSESLATKARYYLNVPFFEARTAGYFVVWLILAFWLNRWTRLRDDDADFRLTERLRKLSSLGLILFALTGTFAGVDWLLTLEPRWYSTMFGALFAVSAMLGGLAFVLTVLPRVIGEPPLQDVATPKALNDLGSLLFAFVMLWAYMSFSQYLIVWSGNLTEENFWYLERLNGGWEWVGLGLALLHFFLPFFLLLSRDLKRNPRLLGRVACWILCMHYVDLYWIVEPSFHPRSFYVHWLDVVTPIAIGGLWIGTFTWQVQRRPLLAGNNPALAGHAIPEESA